jgi:hypothetical protein
MNLLFNEIESPHCMSWLLIVCVVGLAGASSSADTVSVTFNNLEPRVSTTGEILNVSVRHSLHRIITLSLSHTLALDVCVCVCVCVRVCACACVRVLCPPYCHFVSLLQAHDGTIRFAEGFWWLHAASYGAGGCLDPPKMGCTSTDPAHCGFQPNHNVSIWKSPNLANGTWSFVGNAVECESAPDCKIL